MWDVLVEFKPLYASLQDTTILHADLPLLTCIYGALWTPFFLFDATVKAEAFDNGLVRPLLLDKMWLDELGCCYLS